MVARVVYKPVKIMILDLLQTLYHDSSVFLYEAQESRFLCDTRIGALVFYEHTGIRALVVQQPQNCNVCLFADTRITTIGL